MLYPHLLLLPIRISDYKYFRGAFNTLWQQFDPEAQTVCIGYQSTQDADVRTAWY